MVKARKCCCRFNWEIRNNSSNVAAVLNPSREDEEFCLNDNNCYCREKRIKPRLFSKPKQCIFEEEDDENDDIFRRKFPKTYKYHYQNEFKNKKHSNNKNINAFTKTILSTRSNYEDKSDDQTDNRNLTKTIPSENSTTFNYLKSSNYEESNFLFNEADNQIIKYMDSTNLPHDQIDKRTITIKPSVKTPLTFGKNLFANSNFQSSSDTQHKNDHYKIREDTVYDEEETENFDEIQPYNLKYDNNNHKKRHLYNSSNYPYTIIDNGAYFPLEKRNISSETNLKQLSDFRKDHYFETHSTEDLMKTVPEHVCVHRFELDNRFLPQALNTDAYGESRCIICGKTMEKSNVKKVDKSKETNRDGGLFPKFYKYGLAPKKIYMVNNDKNVNIEMALAQDQNYHFLCKYEKPNYFNTYALKYQKGVPQREYISLKII